MLRHIILLKVKPGVTQHDVETVFETVHALKKKVPGVMGFACGTNINESAKREGYTHVLMMDFVDKDYFRLFHDKPEYIDIKQQIVGLVEETDGVMVIDFPLNLT